MLSKIAPLYKEKGSRQESAVRNYLNGAMKNIIFITREKNSLTLLIPCSSVPSMVGNGGEPNTTYAPIMHPNTLNRVFEAKTVSIALK